MIFYDRLSGEDALEIARRDARRVYVGKTVGANAWPQDRINQLIVAEARQGNRVVRLKSGDPGIFGRAGEELDAARAAGVEVEIVPGITAASAAAASAGQPLTERGQTDALVLATARSRPGDTDPNPAREMRPGTTGAYYMAARQVARIEAALTDQGAPRDLPCTMVTDASKPEEQIWRGPLCDLAQEVQMRQIEGSAMILITWPKDATAMHHPAPVPLPQAV